VLKVNAASGFGSSAPGGDPSLGFLNDINQAGLGDNLTMCLDAGAAGSYTSGQSWLDLTDNNADWHFGANASSASDDPTFNGSAGGLSSSEYMSTDGGDRFRLHTLPSNMNDWNQAGSVFSFATWWYFTTDANVVRFIVTLNGSGLAGLSWGFGEGANDRKQFVSVQAGHGGAIGTTDANINAWNFLGLSFDSVTGSGGGFHYLNGAYNQVSSSDTWDATLSGPTASSHTAWGKFCYAEGNAGTFSPSGTRCAGTMAWDVALTKANFDTLWAVQKLRFGL